MPVELKDIGPPSGFQRLFRRAPICLYRWGPGGLLRDRFLLLHHTGRKSGKPRQTVLEVARHDPSTDAYFVASGLGVRSDWYRNITHTPKVSVQISRQRWDAVAVRLDQETSGMAMVDYARRNPRAAIELMRICGYRVDGSDEDYFILGWDHIPYVVLEPTGGEGRDRETNL